MAVFKLANICGIIYSWRRVASRCCCDCGGDYDGDEDRKENVHILWGDGQRCRMRGQRSGIRWQICRLLISYYYKRQADDYHHMVLCVHLLPPKTRARALLSSRDRLARQFDNGPTWFGNGHEKWEAIHGGTVVTGPLNNCESWDGMNNKEDHDRIESLSTDEVALRLILRSACTSYLANKEQIMIKFSCEVCKRLNITIILIGLNFLRHLVNLRQEWGIHPWQQLNNIRILKERRRRLQIGRRSSLSYDQVVAR